MERSAFVHITKHNLTYFKGNVKNMTGIILLRNIDLGLARTKPID